MSIQDDINYLKRLNLDNFKQIEKNKFNFRCPICHDSQKSKYKARGYAIPHRSKDSLFVYCHNCNYENSFFYFLKDLKEKGSIDELSFNGYAFKTNSKNENCETITIEDKSYQIQENKYLINIGRFKDDSIVKKYLQKRKVGKKFFKDIYFSINFKKLINDFYIKEKYQSDYDLPRIVFPIINHENNQLIGFQGRCIYTSEKCFRYLNIKLNEIYDFVFEQKNLDKNQMVFCTEGIFDCLMLNNSISMLGSNLSDRVINRYKKIIFIFDNEKRNNEIIKKYEKIISKEGIGLFIWPEEIKYKDINQWGMKERKEKIQDIILENSFFSILEKNLHFSKWR